MFLLLNPQASCLAFGAVFKTEARLTNVATKQDLELFRTELKADITELRAEMKTNISEVRGELKAEIAEAKSSLIRWMFGFFIGQVAVLAGLIKLLK
jgi:hypothetical protein